MLRATKYLLPNIGSSLQSKISMMFARQKRDLKKLSQMSYIAQLIMKEIEQNRSLSKIKEHSLTQQIIKSVQSKTHIDEDVRKEMLRPFTEGIPYDSAIFKQKRHQDLILNSQTNKDPKKSLLLSDTKIRYFPTTLISGQVFSELRTGLSQYLILTGHSGISKSISAQLFWYLSNIVCEYRCRQESEQKLKQNQILEKVPKLIYWNIVPKESPTLTRSKMLKQLFEIGDDLKGTNYFKQRSFDDPTDFYKQHGIDVILLFDQFNLVVNLNRDIQAKKASKKINEISKSTSIQLEQSKKEQNQIQLINFFKSLTNIRKNNFARNIYLSSVQIEKQHLTDFKVNRNQGNVATIDFHRLRFENLISSPMAIYQLIDFFMFEIKQKLDLPLYQTKIYNNVEVQKTVRNQLFAKISEKTSQFYLTPLLISQNLRTKAVKDLKTNLNTSLERDLNENIVNSLVEIFQLCLSTSQENLSVKVNNFLSKGTHQQKTAVLADMFLKKEMQRQKKYKAFQKAARQQKNKDKNNMEPTQTSNQPQENSSFYKQYKKLDNNDEGRTYYTEPEYLFEFSAKNLIRSDNSEKMKLISSIKSQPLDANIDKKLFYYETSRKMICSYYTYSDIQKYIGRYHQDVIEFLLNYPQDKMTNLKQNIKDGHYFESLFIEALSGGNFSASFPKIGADLGKIYGEKFGFFPIPQQISHDYRFLDTFKSTFANFSSSGCQTFAFVPLQRHFKLSQYLQNKNKNKDQQKVNDQEEDNKNNQEKDSNNNKEKLKKQIQLGNIDRSSPSIDLIFINFPGVLKSPNVTLYAIDFTVSTDKQKIKKKFIDFMKRYKQFKDGDQIQINGTNRKIEMQYLVISASKSDQQIKNIMNDMKNETNSVFIDSDNENQLRADQGKLTQHKLSPLLYSIGHIYMGKQQMQLKKISPSKDAGLNNYFHFDRLVKLIQKIEEENNSGH